MLYEKLVEYSAKKIYPMHMPGHKRVVDDRTVRLPYDIDITEISGFDNLQNPTGVLLETAELAASLYGSDKAFLLVGGSSVGLLAAIGAHVSRGEKILISRNSHISVFNAIALFGLFPVYLTPEIDEINGIAMSVSPESVNSAIKETPDIKAVVITSPTYEGFISDISSIAAIAHKNDIPLIVDSAHGAHLGFSYTAPKGAVCTGADVVVMSLHKTLPAMTQCALLHTIGIRANNRGIERLLSVFQTTSPSYILMASIDNCLRLLASEKETLFEKYENMLSRFHDDILSLKHISIIGYNSERIDPRVYSFDRGKLVITVKESTLNGVELADILRKKYKIETETASPRYVLAMTSIFDSDGGLSLLANALLEIDKSISTAFNSRSFCFNPTKQADTKTNNNAHTKSHATDLLSSGDLTASNISNYFIKIPPMFTLPDIALTTRGRTVALESALGSVSLEYVWAYPPGIPLIAPGEIITAEFSLYFNYLCHFGIELRSTGGTLPLITVIEQK